MPAKTTHPKLRTVRIVLWTAVVLVAMAATGAYFINKTNSTGALGQGDYALVTGQGAAFTPASLQGHPSMLFFGFTHCADVCPTTLAEMASWYEQLGAQGNALQAYFVTVDPERDPPAVIDEYVHRVSDRITAVSGSRDQTNRIIAAWKVYAKKVDLGGGEYNMDHTASVFLLNSKGQFEGTIAYGENGDTAIQKLKKLIREN